MKQHFSTPRYHWQATCYPGAKEAVITLQPIEPLPKIPSGKPVDHERAEREASRRAKTKCRRLCVANGLDRLWTLTYETEPESEAEVLADVARFMRKMRALIPKWRYLYVLERGSKNGRLHVHFATNAFVPKQTVAARWRHGFVDARRLSTGRGGDPRAAARYLSKYVSKAGSNEQRGRHRRRFIPGEGLRLTTVRTTSSDYICAERSVETVMASGPPNHVWRSSESEDWRGPPCTVAFW